MLDNNAPAVNADAHDHAGRIPRRNDAARAAAPIASRASTHTEPTATSAGPPGASASNHRPKCDRIAPAQRRNRRTHPRTVSAGTPNLPATFSWLSPADNAAPITPAESRRRSKHTSGNNT